MTKRVVGHTDVKQAEGFVGSAFGADSWPQLLRKPSPDTATNAERSASLR